jgi:nitroreductase
LIFNVYFFALKINSSNNSKFLILFSFFYGLKTNKNYMTFLEIAKTRYSCRRYKPDPIEEEKLLTIIEAIRVAPSAVNYQPWHFIIIRLPDNKEKVMASYHREWAKSAPVLIVACGDKHKSWKRSDGKDHLDIDLAIAIDHLTLQAAELGLATCWICNFNPKILKQNLQLPENFEPVAIIPLGYPEDECDINRHDTKRKPHYEFIHWESFETFI